MHKKLMCENGGIETSQDHQVYVIILILQHRKYLTNYHDLSASEHKQLNKDSTIVNSSTPLYLPKANFLRTFDFCDYFSGCRRLVGVGLFEGFCFGLVGGFEQFVAGYDFS